MAVKRVLHIGLSLGLLLTVTACSDDRPKQPNLVLFIPDGLRALSVTPEIAPTMAAVRDRGVNFTNPHALFPTFTMPNASGMATGHYLGDTGTFGNTVFTGYAVPTASGSLTPFIEADPILGDIDAHFSGDYLNEITILKAARARGFSTAAIGKLGPILLFDHTERTGEKTIAIDDATGTANGIPLSAEMKTRLETMGLKLAPPSRGNNPGENGNAGDAKMPGAKTANITQQAYFADIATKVVLPLFKERNKPFVLVFWSRDPDGTQHNQGDSPNTVTPGINGPTSFAAIRNADDNLKQIIDKLKELGLADTTDILIASDHGFSTISKESQTSAAAHNTYSAVPEGLLPPGFLAIDLAKALSLPLFDPDSKNGRVADDNFPRFGNGLIGENPSQPDLVVAANGGSDLLYLPNKDKALAARAIAELLKQDYISGIFVDEELGKISGTLPLTAIRLKGSAITPTPSIVVSFRSYATGCDQPLLCTVSVADSRLQQGQGMHGSFSRSDTMNFLAAAGPSFKTTFTDPAPISNPDIGKTIAHILGLNIPFKGMLMGRVIEEALPGGTVPTSDSIIIRSEPSTEGLVTTLMVQRVGNTAYFDAGGFPGRTIGVPSQITSR